MSGRLRRSVPGAALAFCGVGLLGLYLPLVTAETSIQAVNQLVEVDTSLAAIPVAGWMLTLLFLGFSVLPAVDLFTRNLRLTGLLLVPAAVGLVPAAIITAAALAVATVEDWLSAVVPAGAVAVGAGAGAMLLLLAEAGILAAAVVAVVAWWRGRGGQPQLEAAAVPGPTPGPGHYR